MDTIAELLHTPVGWVVLALFACVTLVVIGFISMLVNEDKQLLLISDELQNEMDKPCM